MKASALKYTVLSLAATLAIIIIALVPFHAFLTVSLSDFFGHYTQLRLWKEALLVIMGIAVVYLLLTDHKIRTHTLTRRLVWLVVAYAGLHLLTGFLALRSDEVTLKATLYGILVNLRFLAFFFLVWAVALRTNRLQAHWQKLLIWPAVAVVLFGLLQVSVLPTNFLSNFGYSVTTIEPFETVNSNDDYVRISSTLRGPNPLGAYLIIPCVALLVLLLQAKKKWRLAALLASALLVLAASFSRSGAVGALIGLVLAFGLSLRTGLAKKYVAGFGVGLIVLLAIGAAVVPKNSQLENIVFHTDSDSAVAESSNDQRAEALRSGVVDIRDQPLGEGPGSAGPASVYNANRVEISENYFLQIGQEVGVIGLLLFILINAGVGYLLWLRRADPLAMILFASLVGITFVNMVSHAWTDDTLAYVWWGLAGIAMARLPLEAKPLESVLEPKADAK